MRNFFGKLASLVGASVVGAASYLAAHPDLAQAVVAAHPRTATAVAVLGVIGAAGGDAVHK